MKKLFLVGALAASMAFSSSALAAVDYGQDLTLTASYADGAISVDTLPSTAAADGQLTILILNNDADTVTDGDIMYIDQATAGATDIFQDMGLLNPDNAQTAYVRVGGDNNIGLLEYAVSLSTGTKFVFGDVNSGAYVDEATSGVAMDFIDATDALAVLKASVGGNKAQGGIANIGDVITINK